MKRFIALLLAALMIVSLVGCSSGSKSSVNYGKGKHHCEIKVKDYGTILLELDADTAPITVKNFANLVEQGFYDGITFHRIISGFMIQGGDPTGTGTGGSSRDITGEFAANGKKNNISHVRGVISMARSQAYDSASSQFFIVHQDSPHLDGQYAAFGKVYEGLEVIDKIANVETTTKMWMYQNCPRKDVVIKTIEEITE